MEILENRFYSNKIKWRQELDKIEAEIQSKKFRDEDLNAIKLLRGNLGFDEEDQKFMQDPLIVRLKENKANSHLLPDDICNILKNDLFQRKK